MVSGQGATSPPAAGTPALELKESWAEERRRIIAARFRVKRDAEERGENICFAVAEPPIDVPPYWRSNTEPTVTPLIEPPTEDPTPGVIQMPFGVLGRPRTHPAGENQDSPEDHFRRASLRNRVKGLFGISLD